MESSTNDKRYTYSLYGLKNIIFDPEISDTQNLLLFQGATALCETVKNIDELGRINKKIISADYGPLITNLANQAAMASRLLFDNNKKGPRETDFSYGLRKERIAYVESFLKAQKIKIRLLKNTQFRNQVFHIDEYLSDRLGKREHEGWFIDMVIPEENTFSNNCVSIKFCRTYISKEHKLKHLDIELDLSVLREECRTILGVVFGIAVS